MIVPDFHALNTMKVFVANDVSMNDENYFLSVDLYMFNEPFDELL
jgi:hypothetical protein